MKALKLIFQQKKLLFWLFLFWLLLVVYAFWSYSQTDPNLVLINWQPYWRFQTWFWQLAAAHRDWLVRVYIGLIVALFAVYWQLVRFFSQKKWAAVATAAQSKLLLLVWLVVISPLIFSYNALSHDVFNYIFNARMVVEYHANPHVQVALDFPTDLWTRFMHNTHTPAPYFYGWTGLSLIPYSLGAGKFLITWLNFRLFAVISLVLLFWSFLLLSKKLHWQLELKNLTLLFFNPLLLIEIIANAHNDVWMLALFVLSLGLLMGDVKKKRLIISILLLVLSISIKYATALLIPVWCGFLFLGVLVKMLSGRLAMFKPLAEKTSVLLTRLFFLSASVLMFGLLFLSHSRQFLPWYLTWSLLWLPLILTNKENNLINFLSRLPLIGKLGLALEKISQFELKVISSWGLWLLAFSFSSLLRYVPWLMTGEYLEQTNSQEKLITWGGGILIFFLGLLWQRLAKRNLLLQ